MPAGADGAQGRCQSPRRWQSLYPSLRLGPSGPRDRAARGREGRRRWRQRGGTRAGTSPSLRAVLRRGLGHPGGEDLEPNSRDTVTNHPRTRSSQAEVPPPPASAPGPVSCLPGRRGSQTQLKTEVWPATASLEVPGTHSMKNIPLPCRGPDALHRAPCLTPQLLRCPSRIRAWRIQWLLPKVPEGVVRTAKGGEQLRVLSSVTSVNHNSNQQSKQLPVSPWRTDMWQRGWKERGVERNRHGTWMTCMMDVLDWNITCIQPDLWTSPSVLDQEAEGLGVGLAG
ncbi:uncharacterized protein [Alexandromys fortis]|uniref:uncharacterized protein isoform X1 n=1 Tax=Alexandromys fortis TaxID=100897 RepID=UPI0021530AA4|nr:uncharacterized protein LOC126514828 isoform X1 [Microtus fortis]